MIDFLHDTTAVRERSDILARALDPADPSVSVVAWPGRRIAAPLQMGDIIVRQPLAGPARTFILTGEVAENGEVEAEAADESAAQEIARQRRQLEARRNALGRIAAP